MATTTTNYELTKPDAVTEYYDVAVPNANMDKIDTALKANSDATATKETPAGAQAKVDALAGVGNTTTVAALATAHDEHVAGSAYVAPTLLNGWVNYGNPTPEAAYAKDAHGFVHLKGMIKSGTATINTLLFTLPPGYTPEAATHFAVYSQSVVGLVSVYSNGDVAIISGSAEALGLNGIIFKAT